MRKILIKILLIILFLMNLVLILIGLWNGNLGINSFFSLQQKTTKLNEKVYDLQTKTTSEYKAKKQALIDAISNYQNKKQEYENVIEKVQSVGNVEREYVFDLYDIDFLWTIIGNYATKEGITLKFDVSKLQDNDIFVNTDYILCDLNFTVSGQYLSIVNFIYDLEHDERLKFEIRNFSIEKKDKILQSSFIVKSIPINNTNFSILEFN